MGWRYIFENYWRIYTYVCIYLHTYKHIYYIYVYIWFKMGKVILGKVLE